ncbi:Hypothetical predicted protein [Octopus vulgaris]|uniref:Uncharacterized protein n=1 Tax=Octopus vulgaris TaxID=6645 RepID=A0AA36EXY0_OCTVU|nr:Hypothetical predicted protein [Octopus vulgaris]
MCLTLLLFFPFVADIFNVPQADGDSRIHQIFPWELNCEKTMNEFSPRVIVIVVGGVVAIVVVSCGSVGGGSHQQQQQQLVGDEGDRRHHNDVEAVRFIFDFIIFL